jgi:hypothetical protein
LFTITAMPFISSLRGQYGGNPLAVGIFAVDMLLVSLATQATLLFGQRRDVLIAPADFAEARRDGRRPGVGEHQRRHVLMAADSLRAVVANRWPARVPPGPGAAGPAGR